MFPTSQGLGLLAVAFLLSLAWNHLHFLVDPSLYNFRQAMDLKCCSEHKVSFAGLKIHNQFFLPSPFSNPIAAHSKCVVPLLLCFLPQKVKKNNKITFVYLGEVSRAPKYWLHCTMSAGRWWSTTNEFWTLKSAIMRSSEPGKLFLRAVRNKLGASHLQGWMLAPR